MTLRSDSSKTGGHPLDRRRPIVQLLAEICDENGISRSSSLDDWVHELRLGRFTTHVYGYDFSVNSATAHLIAKDKAATAAVLGKAGLPVVPHRLFYSPFMDEQTKRLPTWQRILDYFDECNGRVVCKPTHGTGGNAVTLVTTAMLLEAVVHRLFASHQSICLSPFFDEVEEYRVIVVRDRCELVYGKVRPFVVGDGISTIASLIARYPDWLSSLSDPQNRELRAANDWTLIPAEGTRINVIWQHGLGVGSEAKVMSSQDQRVVACRHLALDSCRAIGLQAASVDIFVGPGLAHPMVLEVNAGIMMDRFIDGGLEARATAKKLYSRILQPLLSLPDFG